MALVDEVLDDLGSGILFILDGFDELPNKFQRKGFLVQLISGKILPASTILVTSRPSATDKLLVICRPRIQRHIEILGFTQESVEDYAASVLSDPETLEKFKDFISASDNPAINSLMYIPLNAAIILEIYQNCKSNSFLPHTLTELYTQLCLTYVNRYLINSGKSKIDRFNKLPRGLYNHFLELSKKAFEGVKHQLVTFHTMDPSLVHFGLLNAVPALYGGGKVSYNFLHLTLQEFLAAYHISQLREGGLEFLEQYGKNEQLSVVLRFVAGLTQFKYYQNPHFYDTFFNRGAIYSKYRHTPLIFLQCLYEAQTVKYFPMSDLAPKVAIRMDVLIQTPLDFYIVGYCISAFPTGLNWKMSIDAWFDSSRCSVNAVLKFFGGLKTNYPCASALKKLKMDQIEFLDDVFFELKQCSFIGLTKLELHNSLRTDSDMIKLSKVISLIPSLEKLDVSYNSHNKLGYGLLEVLQQLSQSNVKALNLCSTGFSRHLYSPTSDYSLALKKLIDPSFGKLQKFVIDRHIYEHPSDNQNNTLLNILSAPSSLKHLSFKNWHSLLPGFESNKYVTNLKIHSKNGSMKFTPKMV